MSEAGLFVAIVGFGVHLAATYPKLKDCSQVGLVAFGVGLLAFLLRGS